MLYNLNLIRKLARSYKWQSLYRRSKDVGGIQLFGNTSDFSDLQMVLFQWLEIYDMLHEDILTKKPYIDYEILESDIRTDAYLHVRRRLIEKENQPQEKGKKGKKENNVADLNGHAVYFRKG